MRTWKRALDLNETGEYRYDRQRVPRQGQDDPIEEWDPAMDWMQRLDPEFDDRET
jgi:hypothetical protein